MGVGGGGGGVKIFGVACHPSSLEMGSFLRLHFVGP